MRFKMYFMPASSPVYGLTSQKSVKNLRGPFSFAVIYSRGRRKTPMITIKWNICYKLHMRNACKWVEMHWMDNNCHTNFIVCRCTAQSIRTTQPPTTPYPLSLKTGDRQSFRRKVSVYSIHTCREFPLSPRLEQWWYKVGWSSDPQK